MAHKAGQTKDDPGLRVVELPPMRVAYYRHVAEQPEWQAWDTLVTWAGQHGLLASGEHPRFFGFNNPNPSEDSAVYGFEVWVTVEDQVEGDEVVQVKSVPGGLYAVMTATWEEFFAGAWSHLHRALGPWMKAKGYEYHDSHRWLEEHVPGVERLEDLPALPGEQRWSHINPCVPIKLASH